MERPVLGLVLTAAAVFLLAERESYAFRCKGRIVSESDSMQSVYAKCGPPTTREAWEEEQIMEIDGVKRKIKIQFERWSYDRGPQTLVRILTFRNRALIKIKTGGYGKSRQEQSIESTGGLASGRVPFLWA